MGKEGLAVGVEERAVVLTGVEDLAGRAADLVEGKLAREVGVEGLEGLAVVGKEDRPVGVAGLVADLGPPDDEGLLFPVLKGFSPFCKPACLDAPLLLVFGTGSSWIFVNCNIKVT